MSTLTVPGARLFYEVTGSGPLLILIPGARGDGEVFRPLARELAAHYQVVIYDRRGFSRSHIDRPQADEYRLTTDAEDVRVVIEHLTDQPAIVFGNSSGAIVALEVMSCFPAQVRIVVAHEPPAVLLLPDAAKWLAFFDGVYDTYHKQGIPQAMHQFANGTFGSIDRQVIERTMRERPNEYALSNLAYWMEHELRQYPRVELDLAALDANAERIVLAGGREAQDQLPSQPNRVLAKRLGNGIVDFPGGHLGFMSHPVEFAKALMDALKDV